MSINPYYIYPAIPSRVIIRQPGGTFKAERTGLAIQTEKFIGNYNDLVTAGPLQVAGYGGASGTRVANSPNPFFPSLLLFSSKITKGKGALGTWEAEYRGLDPALSQIPPPIYTLELSTSNEPIETHPLFTTTIAGSPSGPLNQAQFIDGNGFLNPAPSAQTGTFDPTNASFKGFIYDDSNPSPYIGITDYLAPGAVWKATYVSYQVPSTLGNVGKIDSPIGPVPGIPGGYDWLNIGISFTDNAGLYRIEESWRLSGPNGWNSTIYGS